jgi:hypothetical protein
MILKDFSAEQTKKKSALSRRNLTTDDKPRAIKLA